MRWFLAVVLLVALVGCGEKKPTAAERATVFMAAKSELERLEKQKAGLIESHRQAIALDVQFSEAEMQEYEKACQNIDKMINDVKKVMTENNPVNP